MDTIKCKPWGKDQGEFVLVNASEFDPAFHQRADAPADANGNDYLSVAELRDWLSAHDVAFKPNAKRAELLALYETHKG